MSRPLFPLLLSCALAGCTPGAPTASGEELGEYCAVATLDDLAAWTGDVVVRCTHPAAAAEHDEAPSCRALRRGAELTLPAGTIFAQPAGDRVVALTAEGRLFYGDAPIADWAAEPRVSEDGRAVAYVALAAGVTEAELGAPTEIVWHDLAEDRREVVSDDPEASTPFPIPGTREVLFVSTRSGVAGLWRGAAGQSAEPLTNVGMTRTEQGFVPVPARQLVWLGSGEAVFTAHHEEDRLWRLDVTTGAAEELGPGAWPRANPDGSVLGRTRASGDDCAARYLEGRTP